MEIFVSVCECVCFDRRAPARSQVKPGAHILTYDSSPLQLPCGESVIHVYFIRSTILFSV